MDAWKCDSCNMKFGSRTLYETHRRKFCNFILGDPPGPASASSQQREHEMDDAHLYRRGKSTSPKELVSLSLPVEKQKHRCQYHQRLSPSSPESQRMSALEQEKVEELKAYKTSLSLQRAYQHSKMKLGQSRKVSDSRQSRSSTNYLDATHFDDQMNQLVENHQEQLDQLRAHNERLKEEKQAIQERMNSLGLRSRQKQVSQGSVDKQLAEFEGLRKYIDYKSKELSNNYKMEMTKLKDLKKNINQSAYQMFLPETPLSTKSSPVEKPKDTVKFYTGPQTFPLNVQQASPLPLQQYAVPQDGGILSEINALKMSYLQGGGVDPEILSQIKQLELEARSLQHATVTGPDIALQQQIMAYQLANQKLEQELQLLRMERQQNDGLRKTPELSTEFQRLKSEHLEKMAGLKQESEMLKQLTEIERMKKELNELKGNKIVVGNDNEAKQKYDTPFLMSTSGMEKSLLPSPYDPSAGFSIFLDFVLGMPASCTTCRLAVGIYNGTELVSDVKVLPLVNLVSHNSSKIPPGCVGVFGVMYPFPKCAPLHTLSLIVELQANGTDDPDDPHKLFSKGWTKMELFDTADRLMSGRWKIPLRVPPIKTYLSYNELNRIPQVGMAELYIRLVNARDVKQEEILNPQPLQYYIYKFPSLDNLIIHHHHSGHRIASVPSTAASDSEPPLPPPTAPPRHDIPGPTSFASLKSHHSLSDSSSIMGFQVDQLCNIIDGEVKVKITAYNQQDGEVLKAAGETPVVCVTKSVKQDFLKDIYVFGLQEVLFRHAQRNSNSIVVVRVYLQPKDSDTDEIAAVNLLDESRLAAWTLIPLTHSNGRLSRQSQAGRNSSSLNVGIHTVPLFFPPIPDVTDMPVKINKYPNEWSRYGLASLRMTIFSGFQRPLERPSTPPEYMEENEVPKNAWIKNGRPSVTTQPFIPGNGFDLYIDGGRFFPDSVTFTKVAGRIMDKNYYKIGPDIESQSKLYSDIYNPEFDQRIEFREPVFPATSMLMLKVYTVDRISNNLCCLGYSVLPIFLKLGTTNPPSNNSDTEKISLNEGPHQIRIFNGVPDFSQPLGPSLIEKLRPVPCASLLVRIVQAACHPNGRPKETSEFPESQWKKEGLIAAKPLYEEGQYFSLSCEPSLGECQIFHSMVLRQPLSVRESVKLLAIYQETNMKKDQVIASWIKAQLTRSIDVAPEDFNLNCVALYHQLHGLKVSVDGARNLPWSNFTFATFCFSPPGSFYRADQADPIVFSSHLVYSSDVRSPVWLDEMKSFPRRLYHRFLVLLVHVHEVTADFSRNQEVYGLKGQGWTAIQVFNEGYVLNGSYQLPLYQGEPSESILDALQNDYCQDVLAAFRRNKTIKFLEGASVFLRLSDSRRQEELSKPMAQVLQDHLPKENLEGYKAFNPSKPTSSLLPLGVAEEEFSYSLPEKFKEMMKQIFATSVSELSKNQNKK